MMRIGLIGCGGIAGSHVQGFAATGRARVARVWDKDGAARRRRAAEWGVEEAARVDEVFAADIDAISVATPGFAHREFVERAAEAKKPVLCEKPVALNMEDALAMEAALAKTATPCLVAFNFRHEPLYAALREALRAGVIGGAVSAWAHLSAPASSERWRQIEASGHWRASMELSGGRINEFCSHTIDWLLWVLGRPISVYGRALHVTEGFGLDDADYAMIECECGSAIMSVHRHAGAAPERNYGIQGHGGSVALRESHLLLTRMDQSPEPLEPGDPPPSKWEHFLRVVEGREAPKCGMSEAMDTLRVCLAFNRSAASGKVEMV